MVSVLLSASVERCFVSRMRDFFYMNVLDRMTNIQWEARWIYIEASVKSLSVPKFHLADLRVDLDIPSNVWELDKIRQQLGERTINSVSGNGF